MDTDMTAMAIPQAPSPSDHRARQDGLPRSADHDPYRSSHKASEPSTCPDCGATYHQGRWQWGEPQPGAAALICPACQRIRDHVPAGELHLCGPFLAEHRQELLETVRAVEAREKAEHPLERILDISAVEDGSLLVRFTGVHLTHGVGEALQQRFKGTLEAPYGEGDAPLRARWQR